MIPGWLVSVRDVLSPWSDLIWIAALLLAMYVFAIEFRKYLVKKGIAVPKLHLLDEDDKHG